jgi:hypothetical protein
VANFTHFSGLIAGWLYFQVPSWLEKVTRHRSQVTSKEAEGAADAGVDAILDKISRKGAGALTGAERRELDEYARKRGGRA